MVEVRRGCIPMSTPVRTSRLDAVDLPNGLSLLPRLQLSLTLFRTDPSPKPIDEWKIKGSLLEFIRVSLSLHVPDEDIQIFRFPDIKKRKRHDPVARGKLFIRDLGFLKVKMSKEKDDGRDITEPKVLDLIFVNWRNSIVSKMDGMELNTEGVKFQMKIDIPAEDDFDQVRQLDQGDRDMGNYWKFSRQQLDTLVLSGLPSRWFAEPRVSSKPSMLVSHTIFSGFGKIKNLNVTATNDLDNRDGSKNMDIISALQCKISVQFVYYEDFCNALRVFCGRSMNKEGSRLPADYLVSCDRGHASSERQHLGPRSRIYKRDLPGTGGWMLHSDVTHSRAQVSGTKRFRE